MRRGIGLSLLLTGALGMTACGADEPAETADPAAAPEETLSVTMGMAHDDTFTAEWWGWLAADQLGYYEDLGLDVEFIPTGGSGNAVEQLAAGNLDAANPSMPSVGEALLSGIELVNVYTYSNGAIFGIFAAPGSGIESVADLRGKNIGISEPGGGEVAFLEAALRAEGIDPITDVSLIPIGEGGPETFQAIESGQVDAYSSAYNDVFALQSSGLDLNDITPEGFDQYPARGIVTTPEQLEENEEALRRLAIGTAMGTHFCFTNLDACEQMLREEIPEVFEVGPAGTSQGELRFQLAQEQVAPADENSYGAHRPDSTAEFIETIASTMENPPEVDVDSFLFEDFIDAANDFDRAAVEADAQSFGE